MLNRKTQIEAHKKASEQNLATRLELLKAKGLDDDQIKRDARIKHFRAQVRKAKHQLAGIAAMTDLIEEKAVAKAGKAAAATEPRQKTQKASKAAAPKKPKKERKPAAEGTD
jgi:hypothetical protein